MTKALVLLSGGQDSTVSLAWAINKFNEVESISFDYGQKHSIELNAATKIAQLLKVKQTIIPINSFTAIGHNSLVDKNIKINNKLNEKGLPNTFVPGRNIIFLSYAAAFAYNKNINNLVIGVSQADYSGYPDCHNNTIKATEKAISLGMNYNFIIHTPLMSLNKEKIWKLSHKLSIFNIVKQYSHSCYNGIKNGCGKCNACILRNKGLTNFKLSLEKQNQ